MDIKYRFTHPVSQVGAGIVLACYMEGICACTYHDLNYTTPFVLLFSVKTY